MGEPFAVLVVGPGALGTALGRLLARGGASVRTLGRDGVVRALEGPACAARGADVAILTVKAYDTQAALDGLRAHEDLLEEAAPLLCVQNGLGGAEACARMFPQRRVFGAVTTHAARRTADGRVIHTAHGDLDLAPSVEGTAADLAAGRSLAERLTASGLRSEAHGSLDALRWRKLAVSCAINGPTAILGVENGVIDGDPDLRALAAALASEVEETARALGIDLGGRALGSVALDVARATAKNRSSMLQDLDAGRETEAAYVFGAVLEKAAQRGRSAPHLETIYRLVCARARAVGQAHPSEKPVAERTVSA